MKILLCSCNGTLPLPEKYFQQLVQSTDSVALFDSLCKEANTVLPSLDAGPDGLFIGCARESACFFSALQDSNLSEDQIITWDLGRFLNGLSEEHTAKLALAYAAAAKTLINSKKITVSNTIEVGPRLLVAGPGSSLLAESLCQHLEVVWVGEDQPPAEIPAINGHVSAIQGRIGAYKIKIATTAAVDPLVCVSCSACRTACPLDAIDNKYQIDSKKCDKCGDCEKACTSIGALKLNRQELEVSTDQIILPGRSFSERLGLYTPQTAAELQEAALNAFAAALDGRIETTSSIKISHSACGHSYAELTGCQKCINVCPNQAISSQNNKIAINHDLCSDCLACASICPSGAISGKPWDSDAIGESLAAFASDARGATPIALSCTECRVTPDIPANHALFPYPKLATLEASHILGALQQGIPSIAVVPCPTCANLAQPQYQLAKEILTRINAADRLSWNKPALSKSSYTDNPFSDTYSIPWDNKRDSLASALAPIIALSTDKYPPLPGPFAQISVDKKLCSGCGACFEACPNDALSGNNKEMTVLVKEISCINCGLCIAVCPEKAITIKPSLSWSPNVFKQITAAQVEGLACRKCGKVFATKRAVEVIITKLEGHMDKAQQELLYLCPDCRVVTTVMGE